MISLKPVPWYYALVLLILIVAVYAAERSVFNVIDSRADVRQVASCTPSFIVDHDSFTVEVQCDSTKVKLGKEVAAQYANAMLHGQSPQVSCTETETRTFKRREWDCKVTILLAPTSQMMG